MYKSNSVLYVLVCVHMICVYACNNARIPTYGHTDIYLVWIEATDHFWPSTQFHATKPSLPYTTVFQWAKSPAIAIDRRLVTMV